MQIPLINQDFRALFFGLVVVCETNIKCLIFTHGMVIEYKYIQLLIRVLEEKMVTANRLSLGRKIRI